MSRKTCPTCRQRWPQGKDPVEADANALMSLRIGDLVKGLRPSSDAMEVELFGAECGPMGLDALARRIMELQESRDLLEMAQGRLESALADLAGTPLAMSAPRYIQTHGREIDGDGLATTYEVRAAGFVVTCSEGRLRVTEEESDGN